MNKHITISIVVPVYNVESFLPRCLDSLKRQTLENFEVILVDDGAADGSGAICDSYAASDPRFRVVHQKNQGVSVARNRGLAMAQGDWIGFVDSDDWVEPDMYERLLKNALKNDAQISACGIMNESADSQNRVGQDGEFEVLTGRQAQLCLMELITLLPSLCNKIYSRKLIPALRNDSGLSFTEDLMANYYAFEKSDRIVIDGFVGYHYMLRSGSAVYSTINQGHIDALTKAEEMLCSVKGDIQLEQLWRRRCIALRLTVLNRIIKSNQMWEIFPRVRQKLLADKCLIWKSSVYVLREKLQVAVIWLCPHLYCLAVRQANKRKLD